MGCIDLVWCVLVLRCGLAVMVWYPNVGFSQHQHTSNKINTTHEITQHISRKLLRMDVLTSETCWALNKEIIKQVTSIRSLFTQLQSSIFIILQVHSTCFGCQPYSSTGVHKSVTTASGTALIYCVQLPPSNWREVAAQKIWSVPEAVVTVLCTPDDGCSWHPKHEEWTCRIINGLVCVASSWTIINIDQRCTEQ